ncbi:nuclear transport factor 2 family protein [Kordiimonas laminariae]|uniref:nuclear transport factor 2 family protein n=1 Tax=Kordiimonas laminariae TaxID=2917717 RepID=UPI001FF118A2|nr:nuclear transport factor 2 family protein [Kordiimonas laminariae]MCK0068315.1 nuclear transport factor 2 family protein [Kordiimonas laminariae]
MLKYFVSVLFVLVVFGMPSRADENADVRAVTELAERYIKATYEADISAMREIFHENAVMNGHLFGNEQLGTPEDFFKSLSANPSMKSAGAPFKGWVEDVRVTGNVASLTVKETGFFGKASFTDYMHLIKLKGRWWIISKTFTSE